MAPAALMGFCMAIALLVLIHIYESNISQVTGSNLPIYLGLHRTSHRTTSFPIPSHQNRNNILFYLCCSITYFGHVRVCQWYSAYAISELTSPLESFLQSDAQLSIASFT
ncbi:hypothetical protein M422DRAFT_54794 [Sphaerobolus stellatus SS14]|uniref:Uncharacterized protein n=1 Tax=Sphaerobolus stellatus (strain SS14) TaxID=990650 RepID=A0A0C9UG53_SPHS4|nr:hypothetical protein M422DRAFT_54794 [Sphaerobolus stellatus SS14]